jgi:ferritin-like metal-binding protein YciE
MALETLEGLFEHELKDAYAFEEKILVALPEMISETKDREIKQALQQHKKETQEQLKRIKQIYKQLKIKPGGENCPGMEGLIREKKSFSKAKPTPEMLSFYNLGAAEKVERYEATHYEGLIDLAEKLQLSQAVDLLNQSLQEEQRMFDRVHQFAQNFDLSQFMPSREEEVEEISGEEEEVA